MYRAATVTLKEKLSRSTGNHLGAKLVEKLGQTPDACWLFCSCEMITEEGLKGIVEAVGTSNLIGCTSAGETSDEGYSTGSAVLGGIASDQIQFSISHVSGLSQDSERAGRLLAEGLPKNVSYIQLFPDVLKGNGCAVLRGISSVLGEHIPVCGGPAADSGEFFQTWQFAGSKLLTDAAVAIGFSGNFEVGNGVRSGWSPVGIAKKVTRARGSVVYELNGQPALEVYRRFLGKHAEKLPAVGSEYPLGLVTNGSHAGLEDYHLLRATVAVNTADGSLTFGGEVPEGALVRLTCGDSNSILEAAEKAARMALSELGERPPGMVFLFSCVARKWVLGRRIGEEINTVRRVVGADMPILGFYTFGEYCPVKRGGLSYLHNETVTVSVLGV